MFGISVTLLTLRPGRLPHLLHSRELLLAGLGSWHCKLTALHMLAAWSVYSVQSGIYAGDLACSGWGVGQTDSKLRIAYADCSPA